MEGTDGATRGVSESVSIESAPKNTGAKVAGETATKEEVGPPVRTGGDGTDGPSVARTDGRGQRADAFEIENATAMAPRRGRASRMPMAFPAPQGVRLLIQ